MKSYTLDIKVGDKVEVGRFRNVMTTVRAIEVDEHGQPVIISNTGKKHLFACRLDKLSPGGMTPAQIKQKAKSRTKKK